MNVHLSSRDKLTVIICNEGEGGGRKGGGRWRGRREGGGREEEGGKRRNDGVGGMGEGEEEGDR